MGEGGGDSIYNLAFRPIAWDVNRWMGVGWGTTEVPCRMDTLRHIIQKVLQDKGIIDKGIIRTKVLQDKGVNCSELKFNQYLTNLNTWIL